uniref:Odorant receptor n=1 Tax=Panagrellus redivivus TaxID=6233 RepID=A0A7E4VWD8_PANRE
MYGAGGIPMLAVGPIVETTEEKMTAVREKFSWTMKMLEMSLIYYGDRQPGCWNGFVHYLRVGLALLMISTSIYYNLYLGNLIVKNWGEESNVMEIVVFTWSIQVSSSMCFLLYWQYCGYMHEIFMTIHHPTSSKRYEEARTVIHQVMTISFVVFVVCILMLGAMSTVHYFHVDAGGMIKFEAYNMFVHPYGYPFSMMFIAYGLMVWNIVLTFYVVVSYVMYFELERFNGKLARLAIIDENPEQAKIVDIGDELLKHFSTKIQLGKMVQTVNNAFEVYVFVMIGTNIPTTVFSLLSFMTAIQQGWLSVALVTPGICFSIAELIGLTAVPAKLYDTILKVEGVLYSSPCIWYPYNERVYAIANAFISHARQSNLGISLWGFAVVSKPLILTTISLTVTYLTLMIELAPAIGHEGHQHGLIRH